MFSKKAVIVCAAAAALSFGGMVSRAATVNVGAFGDQGWYSDDTRSTTGANLVGINSTHAGVPGQTPTAADDTAIAQQIQFVDGPAGSTYGGAVSIDGTSDNKGKSNISAINTTTGFDAASNLLSTFTATYAWYGQPNPTSRTLAFKLGIQSTQWSQSQASFTAQKSGESAWDLVLVHTPSSSDNVWSTVSVDHDSGTWALYRQSGNAFFADPGSTAKTLDEWSSDPIYGSLLFGDGAKVSSIQFGLGSSQKQSIAYVDYLQTNLLNGGDTVNFVPEPSSLGLVGLAGLALLARRSRRRIA